jgi:hypothetical protein
VHCVKSSFTPLESPSIPACRQTGMLGMVEIESISSLLRGGVKTLPFLMGFTLSVIPGLTRNPVFLNWIPAGVYPGENWDGNDGFRTNVEKHWTHYTSSALCDFPMN